jgi:hypothetical protein
MMLYQDKGGNFTEMADYSNILQENYTSEGICDQEVLLQGKSVRESLPTYGFIRTTFYLYEFLSGTTTFMATESSLPTVIKGQGQFKFPSGTPIQDSQTSPSEVTIPQWCLPILISK